MWKRIMELAIFGIGWQTSNAGMAPVWLALFLTYLIYIGWQLYNENVVKIKTRETKSTEKL